MQLATLCYVKKDGKTLMLHRPQKAGDVHQGKWNGLGGKLHPGETPEECVIREVKEESGFTIEQPCLSGLLTFPAFQDEEDWYVYVFTADRFSGKLVHSPEGALEWVEDTCLVGLDLWEGDPIFLRCLEKGKFFSGKFVYQNGKLVDHKIVIYDRQIPLHASRSPFQKRA